MYELSAEQVSQVSGGFEVFVTEEWKHSEARMEGLSYGIPMGLIAGIAGGAPAGIGGAIVGAALVGGLFYSLGYGLSRLENSDLENNSWYNITYTYTYVY